MIRVVRVGAALVLGAAIAAGLYWLFLNTPESSVMTLAASACLALALALTVAIAIGAALRLAANESVGGAVRRAVVAVPLFLLASIGAGVGVWLVARAETWLLDHSGQISAWLIYRFGWTGTPTLFAAIGYVSEWLRWLAIPLAALAAVAAMLASGLSGIVRAPWIRGGWHWRSLAIATLAWVLLVRLPWRWIAWRPANLPATWIEPVFAGTRLTIVLLLIVTGASIVMITVADRLQRR